MRGSVDQIASIGTLCILVVMAGCIVVRSKFRHASERVKRSFGDAWHIDDLESGLKLETRGRSRTRRPLESDPSHNQPAPIKSTVGEEYNAITAAKTVQVSVRDLPHGTLSLQHSDQGNALESPAPASRPSSSQSNNTVVRYTHTHQKYWYEL
jgi:hypothetical protein